MALNDLDVLLNPVSAEAPCGPDLEAASDGEFLELDRLSQGKPEQQIGNTIVPASDPDWKALQKRSIDLLKRSKDLRPAVQLARSLARTDGWPGFSKGLWLLRGLVEKYWEGLFPALDPDDGDPMMRLNSLRELSAVTSLGALRRMPLVLSKTLGKFTLRDIEIANNEAPPDKGVAPPKMASIDGAARDCDLDALDQVATAVKEGVANLLGLQTLLAERVEAAEAVAVCSELLAVLKKADGFLAPRLTARKPTPIEHQAAEEEVPVADGDSIAAAPAPRQGGGLGGSISSREEVVKAIDLIMAYYARYEPSSPLPLLMARCKRLVMMSFVDIVKELVPAVLKEVEALKGHGE